MKTFFGYQKLYIGGLLVDSASGERKPVICPGNEQTVGKIAWASETDAELALNAAEVAFKDWSRRSISERFEWMIRLREAVIEKESELREAVMLESGKSWNATEEDFESLINSLEWYAHEVKHLRDEIIPDIECTHQHQLISEPRGVVVAYLAWNFPLLNLAFKLGPALAAGCTIILRPSASTPLSAYLLGEIANSIGFPSGVINILTGPNDSVSQTLSSSKIPRVITMIGSSQTGLIAMNQAATSVKKFGMELGGNAPAIVFDDADLDETVDLLVAVKFGNCGQICVSPNRILVHHEIYDDFVEHFLEKTRRLRVGFGSKKESYDMGPLIDERARNRIRKLVARTIEQGAKLRLGGNVPKSLEKGYFYEPTVFSEVTSEMDIFKTEIFGPLASIVRFKDEHEAIDLANRSDCGLSSYLFTKDVHRIYRISNVLEVGEVHVNGCKYSIYLPHGGVKESGLGHDCSHLALDDYLVKKRITLALKG